MRRIKAVLAYDGGDFFGYQSQQDRRTVQGEIETALQRIFKENVETYAAGRTDTGVHAFGQVVTFRVKYDTMSDNDVKNALNANLPQDIYIRKVETVEDNFNPRFNAKRRIYHYYILNKKEPDIFLRKKFWWFPYELNVEEMRKAAKFIEGAHDFSTFMKQSKGEEKDPVKIIYRVRIFKFPKNNVILVRVEGNSFLRRMVRNIVGALIRVGTSQWNYEKIKDVILERSRSASCTTAPPDGLYLYSVEFEKVDEKKFLKQAAWSEDYLLEGKEWFQAE